MAASQHGVVTFGQLLELGLTPAAVEHRLEKGRLHRVMRGVYAVGRPELTRQGRWMAAILRCGARSALSHTSAGDCLGILHPQPGPIEVSVPIARYPRAPGLRVHRRANLRPEDLGSVEGIPVTSPVLTLVDLATRLSQRGLETAVNEADRLDLVDPESLREALERLPRHPGLAPLRRVLDRHAFVLTDSELERLFLEIVRSAGLPMPVTGQVLHGFRVDFFWPHLGLVVETDGLRYHRTPAQQARDRLRDQTHTAAGLTPLRFTHAQVHSAARRVRTTLRDVAARLSAAPGA